MQRVSAAGVGFEVAEDFSTFKNVELEENIVLKIESKTFELVSNCALNVVSFKDKVPS